MAINKVKYGNTTLIDLTGTTATADKILTGYGAYGRDGNWINGTAHQGGGIESVTQDQDGYVVLDDDEGNQIIVDSLSVTTNGTYTAATGHAYSPVSVNVTPNLIAKTVTPTTSTQVVTPEETTLISSTLSSYLNIQITAGGSTNTNVTLNTGVTFDTFPRTIHLYLSFQAHTVMSGGQNYMPFANVVVNQDVILPSADYEVDVPVTSTYIKKLTLRPYSSSNKKPRIYIYFPDNFSTANSYIFIRNAGISIPQYGWSSAPYNEAFRLYNVDVYDGLSQVTVDPMNLVAKTVTPTAETQIVLPEETEETTIANSGTFPDVTTSGAMPGDYKVLVNDVEPTGWATIALPMTLRIRFRLNKYSNSSYAAVTDSLDIDEYVIIENRNGYFDFPISQWFSQGRVVTTSSGLRINGLYSSGTAGYYKVRSDSFTIDNHISTTYDGLSQVTVNGDADLVAANIKKDVEIFGVTGTYEGSGGGSSNVVTGTFTGTTEGASMIINVPYTGNGDPLALLIYPSEGPFNQDGVFYNKVQRYAAVIFCAIRNVFPIANTNSTIIVRYKNSDSVSTTQSNSGTNTSYAFAVSTPTGSSAAEIAKVYSNYLNVFIASTSYGFSANVEYTYHIVYST